MAISNLVLTQQIYSEEKNGAHAHYREPVPLKTFVSVQSLRDFGPSGCEAHEYRGMSQRISFVE